MTGSIEPISVEEGGQCNIFVGSEYVANDVSQRPASDGAALPGAFACVRCLLGAVMLRLRGTQRCAFIRCLHGSPARNPRRNARHPTRRPIWPYEPRHVFSSTASGQPTKPGALGDRSAHNTPCAVICRANAQKCPRGRCQNGDTECP